MADADKKQAGDAAEYEFSPAQNAVWDNLAHAMRSAGWSWIVFGLIAAGALGVSVFIVQREHASPTVLLGNGVAVLLIFAMGAWNLSTARPIEKIVSTSGSDIANLMDAMTSLQKTYTIQRITLGIAALLMLTSMIIEKLEHLF